MKGKKNCPKEETQPPAQLWQYQSRKLGLWEWSDRHWHSVIQTLLLNPTRLSRVKSRLQSPQHHVTHSYRLINATSPTLSHFSVHRQGLTWGGGSPPAPGGHTGSIFLILSLLHWQVGEGFFIVQLPFWKRSTIVRGTGAVVQSSSPTKQGVSL